MKWQKIKKRKSLGKRQVYDLKVKHPNHNYFANGFVTHNSGGDARSGFSVIDTFSEYEEAKQFKIRHPLATDIAIYLEGHIRHKGIHAAAMVVSERDIGSYVPIGKTSGEIVTEWEKFSVEDMRLIKFDILGLKTLSVIKDALETSGDKLPKTFEEKEVYDTVFHNGDTLGVFQFESIGLSKLCMELKPDSFGVLFDATTLFRPGALHSGQTMLYTNRRKGIEEVVYEHPLLEKLTKDTLGIICYQEQIMQIMNEIGGMSWATAEMARKVITKSKGAKAFEVMREEFVTNANKLHQMPREEAERLFDVVSTFGSYSFNKIHAIGYSMISYWCAWLKTHQPLAFYKAILKYETDSAKIQDYIFDAERRGIKIEYPHINKSEFQYTICDGKIYAGFDSIGGIGKRTGQKIQKLRPFANFDDFMKRAKPSIKIIKGLAIADAFRDFNICKKAICEGKDCQKILNSNCTLMGCSGDYTEIEHAERIIEHTALKPNIDIKEAHDFGNYDFIDIKDLGEENGSKAGIVRGIVTKEINKDKLLRSANTQHVHKFEQHMIYLNINDGTGNLALQVNPWTYELYNKYMGFMENKPIVAFGHFTPAGRKLYCDMIEFPGKTTDIKDYLESIKQLKEGESIIASAHAMVSKNMKSYYRIKFHDGKEGLAFRFPAKLFPGMKVKYRIKTDPFISNMRVIK